MADLPRVDEMSEPVVVGRCYMVPGVVYPYHERKQWWPVIGPKHEDAEFFRFPWQHYHVDGRFLTDRERKWCVKHAYRGGASHEWLIQAAPLMTRCAYSLDAEEIPHPPISYRRRRARAAQDQYVYGAKKAIGALRAAHANDRLRMTGRGWICPHRGAPLGSIAPDERGLITCPLHGLRWCAKTGEARP